MDAVKSGDIARETMESILNAADLLKDKAYDIAADIDTRKVQSIYITLSITPNETTSLDITKTYCMD